jgi:RNA polymerase sigma-70 factor (ECF subfamily)
MSKFKEKLLLVKAKGKDPEAFGQVYDFYVDRIYRFIFFKVSDVQEAEDLTSDVFLKSWQYLTEKEKNNEIDNLNAFLYKIARNIVIDHYRKRSTRGVIKEADVEWDLLGNIKDKKDLKTEIEISSEMQNIKNALKKIKEDYREIIILRYIDDLSITEIAQITEKSKGAVRVTTSRALKTLKSILEEEQK